MRVCVVGVGGVGGGTAVSVVPVCNRLRSQGRLQYLTSQ